MALAARPNPVTAMMLMRECLWRNDLRLSEDEQVALDVEVLGR
jgi:hypothetical protein